MTPIKQE